MPWAKRPSETARGIAPRAARPRCGTLIAVLLGLVLGILSANAQAVQAAPPVEQPTQPQPTEPTQPTTPSAPQPPAPPPTTTPEEPSPAADGEIPPAPTQWVTDRAGIMSDPAQQSLNRRLAAYEAQTGHQIIVWIGQSTGPVPIESFSIEAFEQWKLGRAELDDGLAIFIMVEDRAIRIEVGYGLEPVITDLVASQVIRSTMIPAIERNAWDAAVIEGVEAIVATIEGRAGGLPPDPGAGAAQQPTDPRAKTIKIVAIVIGVILFLILLVKYPRLALLLLFFVGRGGGRNGGGGGFGGGGGASGGGGATGRW